MLWFLRLKHWQVFLVLITGQFLFGFKMPENPELEFLLYVIGVFMFSSWAIFTGIGLYQLLPKKIDLNYTLFILCSFLWLLVSIGIKLFTGETEVSLEGLAALAGFVVVFAAFYSYLFPILVLKSIEDDKKAKKIDCIGGVALLFFYPIGVWFLQPRINKVAKCQIDIRLRKETSTP